MIEDIQEIARLWLQSVGSVRGYITPPLQIAHIYAWYNYKYDLKENERLKLKQEAERCKAEKAAERKAERERLAVNKLPMEKQRRSRMDWSAILPEEIVYEQEQYEQFATLIAMREAGLTYREIGERLGVTLERARQKVVHAQRYMNHPHRQKYGSPAERFMANDFEFRALRPRGKLIAHRYLVEIASMSKRDWLFVASR